MRVALVQVDGKIPNLALMKLATYHKNDMVEVIAGKKLGTSLDAEWDKAYISCIFSDNKELALHIAEKIKSPRVMLGGSGVDLHRDLPAEVEHLMPAYDKFDLNYSVGFTSRGCVRRCSFCVVPEKEGIVGAVSDIYEFWNPKHKLIKFFDNNILAIPDHFFKIIKQVHDNNLFVNFNQGLDIRLMTAEIAKVIRTLRTKYSEKDTEHFAYGNVTYAWDSIKDEARILRGIELLKAAGVRRSKFFILVGFNSTFAEDLYRINTLKSLGQTVYCMKYSTVAKDKKYRDLSRWCNVPLFFNTMTYETFIEKIIK